MKELRLNSTKVQIQYQQKTTGKYIKSRFQTGIFPIKLQQQVVGTKRPCLEAV